MFVLKQLSVLHIMVKTSITRLFIVFYSCTKACIESSIIIATCSSIIPPAARDDSELSEFGGIPTTPLGAAPSAWETFGPERTIHLCEVQITYHGFHPGMRNFIPLSLATDCFFSSVHKSSAAFISSNPFFMAFD